MYQTFGTLFCKRPVYSVTCIVGTHRLRIQRHPPHIYCNFTFGFSTVHYLLPKMFSDVFGALLRKPRVFSNMEKSEQFAGFEELLNLNSYTFEIAKKKHLKGLSNVRDILFFTYGRLREFDTFRHLKKISGCYTLFAYHCGTKCKYIHLLYVYPKRLQRIWKCRMISQFSYVFIPNATILVSIHIKKIYDFNRPSTTNDNRFVTTKSPLKASLDFLTYRHKMKLFF